MSHVTKIAVVAAAIFFLPIVVIMAGMDGVATALLGDNASATFSGNAIGCDAMGTTSTGLAGYQADQLANAATIVAVGKQLTLPEQGWVVAIAAAIQESGLHNLDYGDRDSLGLFQQRPSQGWGTPAQIMDPTYAATQFYQHLLAVPGWQQMSVNDAAQTVQRSAFPNAYAPHEQAARTIVAAVSGATCTRTSAPGGSRAPTHVWSTSVSPTTSTAETSVAHTSSVAGVADGTGASQSVGSGRFLARSRQVHRPSMRDAHLVSEPA
jgi:hypothetical protein